MISFEKKVVLLTGAYGGIGKSIAELLVSKGAKVILSGRDEVKLKDLAQELNNKVSYIKCDLSDLSSVSNLVNQSSELLGDEVNVLINNAGVTMDGLAVRMSKESWQLPIDINLTSAFLLSKSALKPMMKQKWGRIVNISSIVGVMGNGGQSNYAASKAGLIGMSKSLAKEVAKRGITINCIAPGYIETPMTDKIKENQAESILPSIPMGRFGKPEDIANCVAFLVSDESCYITGQTIHINGGMVMV
ncbi:MAG: 3-oxoacyl-[acyl-carrier-protein] reductase FabG [Alphaproteobacteria bacterium MarineAlpha2_Bin1]|nr:MAG: 3-oxoacyl-[acyl-carrier-protein] reductase FabG [Alphaproteobacteria bacterium MarineAlpha2_Bin1]